MTIADDHTRLRAEATALAGRPEDLIQRVSVYFHLHQHSGGNHVFPLLAAHGALWGHRHFRNGLLVGNLLSLADLYRPAVRRGRLASLDRFAIAFKEINRRVCVEAYTIYFLTDLHDDVTALSAYYPAPLVRAMLACHRARRAARDMSPAEKRDLFDQFFLWEQDAVVGPAVTDAVAALDWPLVRHIALRPAIGFRYFPRFTRLWFSAFHNTSQRIDRGRRAFDIAATVGWDRARNSLADYAVMPEHFARAPRCHFDGVKRHLNIKSDTSAPITRKAIPCT